MMSNLGPTDKNKNENYKVKSSHVTDLSDWIL